MFILLACALLLLLFFQLWKKPRRVRLIYDQDPQKETRKKAPKRPLKFNTITIRKQREKLSKRCRFDVRGNIPPRDRTPRRPAPDHFSKVKCGSGRKSQFRRKAMPIGEK